MTNGLAESQAGILVQQINRTIDGYLNILEKQNQGDTRNRNVSLAITNLENAQDKLRRAAEDYG